MKCIVFVLSLILPVSIIAQSNQERITNLNLAGQSYRNNGNTAFAIRIFYLGLQLAEKNNNQSEIANSLVEIASSFAEQNDIDVAIAFYRKAIKIQRKTGDENKLTTSYHQLGKLLNRERKLDEAISMFNKAITAAEKSGNSEMIGRTEIELGKIYLDQQKPDLALAQYNDALRIMRLINNQAGIAEATCKLGEYYIVTGNISHAVANLEESYSISEKLGVPDLIKHSSHLLSLAYEKKGDGLLSVKLYKRYAFMKDSIEHDETRKATIRREVQFEFEKQRMLEQKILEEKDKKEHARIARRNRLQYTIMFLSILIGFGAIISLGYLKISQRLAEVFIFVSVLVLFEFLLILTDPFIDVITDGIPVYKLGINCLMAILVFPLHTFFEKKLKRSVIK